MSTPLGARKDGAFKAVCTTPSFNLTPVGPAMVALPYPVISDLSGSVQTSADVFANGCAVYIMDESSQPGCTGDEAGTGKGLKSGTMGGAVKPLKGSSTVFVNGKPWVRAGGPCSMQGGNCLGIYVIQPAPGVAVAGGRPAESTSPPIQPETPKEEGRFKAWVKQSAHQLTEAMLHQDQAFIGAAKGLANTVPEVLELGLKASCMATEKKARLDAWAMRNLGAPGMAEIQEANADSARRVGDAFHLPKFKMANAAQEGGDKISNVVQLAFMGAGLAKGGVRLLARMGGKAAAARAAKGVVLAEQAKGLAAVEGGAKALIPVEGVFKGGLSAEEGLAQLGTSRSVGDGVRVAAVPVKAKAGPVAAKLTSVWGHARIEEVLSLKRTNPRLEAILTDDEYLAMNAYTTRLYENINSGLRSGKMEEWDCLVTEASSGLKKMAGTEFRHEGTVIRNCQFSNAQIHEIFDVGAPFQDKAFLSTTSNVRLPFPGNTRMYISSKTGIRVDELSMLSEESEVLFAPNTKFQVIDKQFSVTENRWHIYLVEN